ncbi:hypothetical protein HN51_011828 [Arachis hypogaea]
MRSSRSMAKGGLVKDELETKKPTPPQQQNHAVAVASVAVTHSLASAGTKMEGLATKKKKEGFKSISMVERFNCRVKFVLEEPEPEVTVVKLTQNDVPEEDR